MAYDLSCHLHIILEPRCVAENWIRVQECKVVLRWMQTQERPGSGMQMVADQRGARIRRAGGKSQSDREGNTR